MTFMHPSSVNNLVKKKALGEDDNQKIEKTLFAFAEKRQNVSTGNANAQMFLVTTTRIDPMSYVLFGAYNIIVVERGLECDGWLPVVGNSDALDDIQRLKTYMDASMLRVFEGIVMNRRRRRAQNLPVLPREEESESDDDEPALKDYSLSPTEVKELDLLTRDIVGILNRYAEERQRWASKYNSRAPSRAPTPTNSAFSSLRLPDSSSSAPASGRTTPYNLGSVFASRPGTPSRLRDRRF